MNELFSWGGWRRVSYLLKSGSRRKTTLAFLSKGLSHGISLDRVKLREFTFKSLHPADGKVVHGGRPLLSWRIPASHLVFRLVIDLFNDLDLTSPKGAKIELMSPQGRNVWIRKELQNGTWYWRVRAYLGREEVARSPIQNFRVVGGGKSFLLRPSSYVRLHPSVSPPPFFPIGMFSANPESFNELKKAGFNSIQSYRAEPIKIQKLLEAATKSGLKALVKVPNVKDKIGS
ncbi:hypothetical protein ACFLQ0_04110 [Nitrospinota bacterium]